MVGAVPNAAVMATTTTTATSKASKSKARARSSTITPQGGIRGSILPASSIGAIVSGMGVLDTPLENELCEELASEVEYRLRQLAQDALKFSSRAFRDKLTCRDIDSALRLRNVESLYGFGCPDDIAFRKVPGYQDLFIVDDNEVKLDELLKRPLPKVPVDSTFSVHWLAIQGVQPRIPQNPLPREHSADASVDKGGENTASPEHVVRDPLKHVLSREQQMYFEHVTSGIKSGDAILQRAVLHSLSNDAGLHQLVPYFTKFIATTVHKNLRNLALLLAVMRMSRALLSNAHLHIEPYLHQLMPAIMTCLVGRTLCMNPCENHWTLRDQAAALVALICKRFGLCYANLQPRITKTLANAFLDARRALTTHYGAIKGLDALGRNVVRLLLLPHVQLYAELLMPELRNAQNPTKRVEAQQCFCALLQASGAYARDLLWTASRPHTATAITKRVESAQSNSESLHDHNAVSVSASATSIKPVSSLSFDELCELFGESLLPHTLAYDSRLALIFI